MAPLLKLSAAIDWMNHQFGRLAAWAVLAAALISAFNVIRRYAFNLSSNAWLEVQWYMFAVMVLLGAAYTLNKNEHVRVDLLYSNVSDRGRLWIDVFGIIFFLFPSIGILTYETWPIFWDSYVSGETSGNAGGLIRWPVKLLLPLGFGLVFLQGVSELIKRVGALRQVIEFDASYEKPLQ